MLQMFLCLFKLPGCKIAHMHLRSPGSGVDPLPVRLCQKILKTQIFRSMLSLPFTQRLMCASVPCCKAA